MIPHLTRAKVHVISVQQMDEWEKEMTGKRAGKEMTETNSVIKSIDAGKLRVFL